MGMSALGAVLRRSWIAVLACTLVGVGAAFGITKLMPNEYQSNVRLFVSVDSGISANGSDLQGAASFARQSVISYAQIIMSPLILDGVSKSLDNAVSLAELESATNAYAPVGTSILDITVTLTDGELAYEAASTIGEESIRVISEQLHSPNGASPGPVIVETVSPALMPASPVSPKLPLALAMGLFFGLTIGVIVALWRNAMTGEGRVDAS